MYRYRTFRHMFAAAMSIAIPLSGNQTALAIEILPPITITAPAKPLSALINNPQQLGEEDIAVAHEHSIPDVLYGLPGLTINKTGGYGRLSGLLVRGAGGQGLMTLDGIPLLLSLPGLQNLDTLPTEAIETAEIERGPSAAHYSFQALGGAIRLYTRDKEDTGGKLSVEGGSFGILRETLQGGVSGTLGRMTLTLSRGDAFDGTHLAASADNPEREPFRFTQGIMRFSSAINSRILWQGSMLYRKSWVGSDTVGLDKNFRVAFKDDSRSFGQGETWLAQNSLNVKVTPYWHSQLQIGFTQLANTVAAGVLQSNMSNRLYLANWHNQHTLINNEDRKIHWQFNWGGQGRHEQADSQQPMHFDEERTLSTGFLETEAQYRKLSGEIGVRVEHYEQFGAQPLFKTAAAWQITPALTLRASGGTGYRIPSYTELLSRFFGNLNLKPERSASGNLSLEWFPLKKMQLTVNGYYNRYDDLITQVYHPQRGPISINVADASVAGMELDARYAWTAALDSGFSYSYSDNQDLQTNYLLPLRPPHIARVWGKQKLTALPVTLWAETVIRSATWNDSANSIPVDQSVQVNASIRYAVTQQFEVYLRGENLTDNRNPQFYSTDMPGVSVYGGFQLGL